jgi:hypothetical protein
MKINRMKCFGNLWLFVFALAVTCTSATASDIAPHAPHNDSWIEVGIDSSQGIWSIRQRDVHGQEPKRHLIWVSIKDKSDKIEARTLYRYDIDCFEKTAFTDYRAFYSENGDVETSYPTAWLKIQPIMPHTMLEKVSDMVCPETR